MLFFSLAVLAQSNRSPEQQGEFATNNAEMDPRKRPFDPSFSGSYGGGVDGNFHPMNNESYLQYFAANPTPALAKYNECASSCTQMKDKIESNKCYNICNINYQQYLKTQAEQLELQINLAQCEMSNDQQKITCPQGEYSKSGAVNTLESVTKDPHSERNSIKKKTRSASKK